MCKLAYLGFYRHVPQKRRQEAVRAVLEASWEMGNKDGAGLVTWDGLETPAVARSLKLDDMQCPQVRKHCLLHVRHATCEVSLKNTHPMAADGAWLVHNGVVQESRGGEGLAAECESTNDSELVLRAYLRAGRDLAKGVRLVSGWANVAVWDNVRGVLSLFPEKSAFRVWRQDGVTAIVQDDQQASELIEGGLGRPYESDSLKAGRTYEVECSGAVDWAKAIASARKEQRPAELGKHRGNGMPTRKPEQRAREWVSAPTSGDMRRLGYGTMLDSRPPGGGVWAWDPRRNVFVDPRGRPATADPTKSGAEPSDGEGEREAGP